MDATSKSCGDLDKSLSRVVSLVDDTNPCASHAMDRTLQTPFLRLANALFAKYCISTSGHPFRPVGQPLRMCRLIAGFGLLGIPSGCVIPCCTSLAKSTSSADSGFI